MCGTDAGIEYPVEAMRLAVTRPCSSRQSQEWISSLYIITLSRPALTSRSTVRAFLEHANHRSRISYLLGLSPVRLPLRQSHF